MNSAEEIRPDGKQMGNPNGEERPGPNILRRSWACFTYHFLLSLGHIHQTVKDDGLTQLKFAQEGGLLGKVKPQSEGQEMVATQRRKIWH